MCAQLKNIIFYFTANRQKTGDCMRLFTTVLAREKKTPQHKQNHAIIGVCVWFGWHLFQSYTYTKLWHLCQQRKKTIFIFFLWILFFMCKQALDQTDKIMSTKCAINLIENANNSIERKCWSKLQFFFFSLFALFRFDRARTNTFHWRQTTQNWIWLISVNVREWTNECSSKNRWESEREWT